MKKLNQMNINETCKIVKLIAEGQFRQKLLRMGIIKNTFVTIIRLAPLGDPIMLRLRGYLLMIRKKDAESIIVESIHSNGKI